jgi:hypothetical protein
MMLRKDPQHPGIAPVFEKADAKHKGSIFKVKDGSIVPDAEYVVFHVNDNAFAAILPAYLETCKQMGAGPAQIGAVERMITRVEYWRANNLDRLKVPDISPGEALDG